ncbi:hypothetical protein NPIL_450891 [Nephila pilipes]|uniref:Uncharacterized protein n=1 Tax=Nephila pilipes TaxID=299642 RepID=A0A8X6THD3_NEPPI|nr:hypothetical protein NPIL_450891 [Nephila pilipes]
MECRISRSTSPSLTQDKETCEILRLMNERLRVLQMQHEDAYCHIETWTEREIFIKEHIDFTSQPSSRKAEGEYLSFPKCPIPSCPLHTQLPITPEKRAKTIIIDNEGLQIPPARKQAKRKIIEQYFPQIIETSNKFKNLKLQNEMSES